MIDLQRLRSVRKGDKIVINNRVLEVELNLQEVNVNGEKVVELGNELQLFEGNQEFLLFVPKKDQSPILFKQIKRSQSPYCSNIEKKIRIKSVEFR